MKVQFVVRYVNGLKDTVVEVDSSDVAVRNLSAQRVRSEIRNAYPELATKRLKLLHNGRVLSSNSDFSKEIRFLKNQEGEEKDEIVKIYFHCIVGNDLTPEELAQETSLDQQPLKSTSEAPKGFNRLLSQGFSETDIEDLRQQFLNLHGRSLPPNANPEQIQELEDRWIDSTVGHDIDEFPANIRLNPSTGNADGAVGDTSTETPADTRHQLIQRGLQAQKDVFIGVAVGFALGGLAVIFLFLNIGGVFSRKTRMAVASGVIVNLSFGLLRTWNE